MVQVDIITGEPRHRTWTIEEKQSILAAAFAPGAVVKEVARRANISTGQLYTWRKQLMIKKKPAAGDAFARVVAIADQPCAPATVTTPLSISPPATAPTQSMGPYAVVTASELPAIEIEVRGNKVRIPGSMPPALATAVLRALVRR
ncbi:MAG: IS66-like element accessory protein TnpA [Rhodomicrobium sp.]